MQVLNVGHAKLAGKIRLDELDQLGALILNDNQITALSGTHAPLVILNMLESAPFQSEQA